MKAALILDPEAKARIAALVAEGDFAQFAEPRDGLLAGMASMEALLAVTSAGWTAAYLNEPIAVDALLPRPGTAAGTESHLQHLLRIRHGPGILPALRCPMDEVLID